MKTLSQARTQADTTPSITPVRSHVLQRKCSCGGAPGPSGECVGCQRKKKLGIQTKLKVSQPGDRFEREADRVAEQVVRMPAPATSPTNEPDPTIQRVSTNLAAAGSEAAISLPMGESRPLSTATKAFMEPRFGYDFSQVRVHRGPKSETTASQLQARAFTHGQDIWLGQNAKEKNHKLMAHELTHVVQQQTRNYGATAAQKRTSTSNADKSENIIITNTKSSYFNTPLQRVNHVMSGGGGIQPAKKTKVWINTFIPHKCVNFMHWFPGMGCFIGDDRKFSKNINASSRTHQEIEIAENGFTKNNKPTIGETRRVACSDNKKEGCDTSKIIDKGRAPKSEVAQNTSYGSANYPIVVNFSTDASNPLVDYAPAINLDAKLHINMTTRQYFFEIDHDGFPAYEIYVEPVNGSGKSIYRFDPYKHNQTPASLGWPMEWTKKGAGSF